MFYPSNGSTKAIRPAATLVAAGCGNRSKLDDGQPISHSIVQKVLERFSKSALYLYLSVSLVIVRFASPFQHLWQLTVQIGCGHFACFVSLMDVSLSWLAAGYLCVCLSVCVALQPLVDGHLKRASFFWAKSERCNSAATERLSFSGTQKR